MSAASRAYLVVIAHQQKSSEEARDLDHAIISEIRSHLESVYADIPITVTTVDRNSSREEQR